MDLFCHSYISYFHNYLSFQFPLHNKLEEYLVTLAIRHSYHMSQVEHQTYVENLYIVQRRLDATNIIFQPFCRAGSITYLVVTLGVSWFPRLKLGHADIDWQHFKYFDKFSATFKKEITEKIIFIQKLNVLTIYLYIR